MAPDHPQLRKLAIVPAYNEQGMVGRVVREIHRQAPDFDVVVVDDGSTDNTAAEAEASGAVVLRHPFNPGIGGAMQSGFKYALRHAYDVAAQVDGDGQHKPAHLDDLLAKLQTTGDEADMVCGSRFRGDPGYKVPIGRRVGNLIFSVVLTAICRQRITDPTSGFRMTNRRGIELFARDYPHDYPEVEAILMLHAHRLRIHEVPGADERARLRPQLDRLPPQRLLHGQGAAGAVRRPVPPPPDPGRGAAAERELVGRRRPRTVGDEPAEPAAR